MFKEALTEFKAGLLGPISLGTYMLLFFFSGLAILLSIYAHYQNKGKANSLSPEKFSWAYALFENFKRIGAGLIAMFIIFRFATFFMSEDFIKGDAFLFGSIGIGFFISYGLDKAIQYIQTKTSIKVFDMPNPYIDKVDKIAEQVAESTDLSTKQVKQIIQEPKQ